MYLSKIKIENYRLIEKSELDVDSELTLIVGRNNTAKTSLSKCIYSVLNGKSFTFNDYPISKRNNLYETIISYRKKDISFEELRNKIEPISIELHIDYSTEKDADELYNLSPFIIDLDTNIQEALIQIEFRIIGNENNFINTLGKKYFENKESSLANDFFDNFAYKFSQIFELNIYAVNPKNHKLKRKKDLSELKNLFLLTIIPAERTLGEDERQKNSLIDLISDFFDVNEEELNPEVIQKMNSLREEIEKSNQKLQQSSNEILSHLVNNSVGFGYPNAEELQLGVKTKLRIDEQIKNQTQLIYKPKNSHESLPSEYNGLGYKNLIKIEFLLLTFSKEIKNHQGSCIPLLFIEEPESHMHPQMQQSFASYLKQFVSKIATNTIQIFLTTHSSHIANTIDFSQIRYAQKTKHGVIYKNLNEFVQQDNDSKNFISKYLTLTKCDLFFADKAILVEGASERLLIPDMIEKCSNNLSSQYYTLIEVGGAYAFKFIPFIEFLGIPCLIITDIDSVKKNEQSYVASIVSEGETTSNKTIEYWMNLLKLKSTNANSNSNQKTHLRDIMSLSQSKKTIKNYHIEFQTVENELCGRSLEEAIKNVNRTIYNLSETITENDLKFSGRSKTDFALHLIYECNNYEIPKYIKNGLIWLSNQDSIK